MQNRRAAPRVRSLLQGRIEFNNGEAKLDCLIRDISDEGARIELSGGITIPDEFTLTIPRRRQARRAHLRWRLGDRIGIAFQEATEQAEPDLAARLAALERENARLRALIAQLEAARQPLAI